MDRKKSEQRTNTASSYDGSPTYRSVKIDTSVGLRDELTDLDRPVHKPAPQPTIAAIRPTTSGWKAPRLTLVGLYYPLGPCLIRMKRDSLDRVLRTLPDVFRKLSLQTLYKDTPISVVCRSLEQVEFEVSIFASRTNPNDEIVVEIERRDGDVIFYHQYANQVANALSTESGAGAAASASGNQPGTTVFGPCFWNRSVLALVESLDQQPNEEDITGALETTCSMISSDRYDARRLGLESLIQMTDPYKCGFFVAKATAECFMAPKNIVEERVFRGVLEYACEKLPNSTSEFHDGSMSPFYGGATEADFAYLALVVVCQVFRVAAEVKSLDVQAFLNACPLDLIDSFVAKVHAVHEHPHQAYFAVQALEALCCSVPSLRSRINDKDIQEAISVGDSSHLALATASHKLLLSLQA